MYGPDLHGALGIGMAYDCGCIDSIRIVWVQRTSKYDILESYSSVRIQVSTKATFSCDQQVDCGRLGDRK